MSQQLTEIVIESQGQSLNLQHPYSSYSNNLGNGCRDMIQIQKGILARLLLEFAGFKYRQILGCITPEEIPHHPFLDCLIHNAFFSHPHKVQIYSQNDTHIQCIHTYIHTYIHIIHPISDKKTQVKGFSMISLLKYSSLLKHFIT